MLKILQIALNDLRITFRERAILVNLVVIPVFLIIAVGAAQGGFSGGGGTSGSPAPLLVDLIDRDQTPFSAALREQAQRINPRIRFCPEDGEAGCGLSSESSLDEAMLNARLLAGSSLAALIIPQGFGEAVLAGETISLDYRSVDDSLQPGAILQSIEAAAERLSTAAIAAQFSQQVFLEAGFSFSDDADRAAFEQAVYDRATATLDALPDPLSFSEGERDEDPAAVGNSAAQAGFGQSVPGMGTMYVMFTVLAGASTLLLERKNWTLQRLITMPISRAQLLGGKMLSRFLMGMLQYTVAFAAGLLLGVNFGLDPVALILLMMAFAASISAMAFLLAAVVNSDQQASTSVTFLALTLAPLGGAWWPIEIVPDYMQTIAYVSPVGWVMDGFNQLIFYNGSLINVLPNIAVLLLMTLALFGLALRRFRYI